MSLLKTFVEVEVPQYPYEMLEVYRVGPKRCRYCGGKGYIEDVEDTEVCPMCEGEGEIVASVKIEWKPKSDSL